MQSFFYAPPPYQMTLIMNTDANLGTSSYKMYSPVFKKLQC